MRLLEGVQGARARTPPPPPVPRLHLQKFIEETDNMSVYLDMFEAIAYASEWPVELWSIHLRGSLSGAGLLAVSALSAVQQVDYQMVKSTLWQCIKYLQKHIVRKCLSRVLIPTNPISSCGTSSKIFINGWIL